MKLRILLGLGICIISMCLTSRAAATPPEIAEHIAQLQSSSPRAKGEAATILGSMGEYAYEAIPGLIALLSDTTEYQMQMLAGFSSTATVGTRAQEALIQLGEPAIPALIKTLANNCTTQTRLMIISTLGVIAQRESLPLLRSAAVDANPAVRAAGFRALASARDNNAAQLCIDALENDSQESVREAAAACLNALAQPASIPALAKALGDYNPAIRKLALNTLSHIPDAGVISAYIDGLRMENSDKNELAAQLHRLTHYDYGTNPVAWQGWWNAYQESYTL